MPGITELTEAVARYYFKLLAIKDEYEVARLYAETDFVQRVAAQFEGDYTLHFHLAPPLTNKPDPVTGEPQQADAYGPWMMKAFRVLAKLRKYRGTALDVFGRTAGAQAGARADRRVRERWSTRSWPALAAKNHATAVELASIPEHIRGYGHVKERASQDGEDARGGAARGVPRARTPAPAPAVVKLAV